MGHSFELKPFVENVCLNWKQQVKQKVLKTMCKLTHTKTDTSKLMEMGMGNGMKRY